MERMVKSLPERKRRTFRRYMKNGKKDENAKPKEKKEDEDGNELEIDNIPHTREELIRKIEQLKLAAANDEDGEEDGDYFDSDDDSDIDFSSFDD